MNVEHFWGRSPWSYSDLENSRIESIRDDCPLIGIGRLRVAERPSGEQKIEIVREYSIGSTGYQEIISIPPDAFSSIQKHPNPEISDFLLVG